MTRIKFLFGTTFITCMLLVASMSQMKLFHLRHWFGDFATPSLMSTLAQENHYLGTNYFQKNPKPPLATLAFSLFTNMHLEDTRSFLRNEIPGLSNYYAHILVAGEGTDLSNVPIESDLSIADLEQSPKVNQQEVDKHKQQETHASPEKKVMFIYHSHNRESFFPLLPDAKKDNPNAASSDKANVSLLGERLQTKLESLGIGATLDKTDMTKELLSQDLTYSQSYTMSRTVVEDALTKNPDLDYFIDIHRDNQRHDVTTKKINGENYARLYFIVGVENENKEKNLALATTIHERLEKKYPGISRGIFPKDYTQGNGVYNQDLSENALLVEIGGVDNNLDELYRTVDALGEVLGEVYHEKME